MNRGVSKLRRVRTALWGVVVLTAATAASFAAWHWMEGAPIPTAREAGRAAISGDFSLTDHTGRAVTDEDYRGKWLLVFFGYTHCPDVCPTTLNEIAEVMERLGPDAAKLQPLFISVDPERDRPETMAQYVAAFDPRIVGLTGTPEQVKAAAKSYRVYYAKAPEEGAAGRYTMDHTAFLYLMSPEGEFETVFGFREEVDGIVSAIRRYL